MDPELWGLERGMYVEILENKCEGMIRIQDIPNDFFIFDEKEYIFVGMLVQKQMQRQQIQYLNQEMRLLIRRSRNRLIPTRRCQCPPQLIFSCLFVF